jgi:hypothetical protein
MLKIIVFILFSTQLLAANTQNTKVEKSLKLISQSEEVVQLVGTIPRGNCAGDTKINKKLQITDIEGIGRKWIDISVIEKEYAEYLFNELVSQTYIPFGYPEDGCYARAHEMSRIL